MAEVIQQKYFSNKNDLLFAILLKLGGTVLDIEEIYKDRTDDLLYAILKKIGGGGGGGGTADNTTAPHFVFKGATGFEDTQVRQEHGPDRVAFFGNKIRMEHIPVFETNDEALANGYDPGEIFLCSATIPYFLTLVTL